MKAHIQKNRMILPGVLPDEGATDRYTLFVNACIRRVVFLFVLMSDYKFVT